jgi:hypothetical protein
VPRERLRPCPLSRRSLFDLALISCAVAAKVGSEPRFTMLQAAGTSVFTRVSALGKSLERHKVIYNQRLIILAT